MREKRTAQTSLLDPPAIDHPLADGLERASVWSYEHPELLRRKSPPIWAPIRGRRAVATG